MPLFLLFLIVPIIEIALFIQVGGLIGLWPTLLVVVLTALLGTYLLRSQGSQVLRQIRGAVEDLGDPTEPLAHGAMVLFSGALLLTPGFFTDAVGFALMVPGIRSAVYRQIRTRISVRSYGSAGQSASDRNAGPDIIDAEYEELDTPPRNGPSGWTRH